MFTNNLKAKYLLYLPETLYEKNNKLGKIIKLLEDESSKNSVVLLIKYSILLKNKKIIRDIKKLGYKIGVIFDVASLSEKEKVTLSVADYIFIDRKVSKTLNLTSIDTNTIVLENIMTKVDVPGGE